MVTELLPGANIALPDGEVRFLLDGAFDLSAVVVGTSGLVAGDDDLVFYNSPSAPGVALHPGRLSVTPARLRGGAERVVVVATPEEVGGRFGAAPAPVLADGYGRTFARLRTPAPGTETLLLLAVVYRRDGRWRVRAAQEHTDDMVRRTFFAHENPDGKQVWDRAVAAGYAYRKVAENIAAGQRTATEVVRGWMDSPGHRANILDGELTQIGVGHALGGSYGVYWTQVFGIPR